MYPDILVARRRPGVRAMSLGLLLAGLLLTACGGGGGGGGGTTDAPAISLAGTTTRDTQVLPVVATVAPDGSGLVPGPQDTIDTGPAGTRVVRAVGALADGGHAVVWAAPLTDAPAPAWTLWVQAYDRSGARAGATAMLDLGVDVKSAQDTSAVVFPEGLVTVGYRTSREVDPFYPGTLETSVYTAQFNVDGGIVHAPRLLDSLVFDKFYPRSDRLAGPVAMALGQDGSYLVGWRFDPGSYFGREPTFRIQRFAADTEPLGWVQHLRRNYLSGDRLPFDRLRLTMLDEGGWAASFADTYQDLGLVGRIVQNDVARPLGIPHFSMLAPGAWLLDLRRHGSVLFADRHSDQPGTPVAPFSMHFDRQGREQDPASPLPAIPTTAAALRGGDYVAMWSTADGTLEARRYTPHGKPVGTAFIIHATPDTEAAGLRLGGMALAWVDNTGGTSRLVTQRFAGATSP